MIKAIKKKRQKVSSILGQISISADSALMEKLSIAQTQEIKTRSPHLEKLSADSALRKTSTLTDKLNRLISEGAKFEVSADNFQAFGLSDRERQALNASKAETLCTLQQMFLQTNLFNRSPELLESFRMQVLERSAAVSDGQTEIVFQSVAEVSAEWVAEAIEKLNAGCAF